MECGKGGQTTLLAIFPGLTTPGQWTATLGEINVGSRSESVVGRSCWEPVSPLPGSRTYPP